MTELEKALNGLPYDHRDAEVSAYSANTKRLCVRMDDPDLEDVKRGEMLSSLVSGYNPYVFIERGFRCDMGKNIHFEGMAILNYNCTLLDSAAITIGDRTLIGPGCFLICTNHALDAAERLQGLFDNRPIRIGKRVWMGANVTVLPGVTIGDDAVIGAGSVVTKDMPSDVVAVGNPCRVLRPITENDRINKQA